MSEPVPPSLSQFGHYFNADKIQWDQAEPGWGVVIEAHDLHTNTNSSIGFQIVDKEGTHHGLHDVWVELDDTPYHFVEDTEERNELILPKGTLMKAGISCEHFPVSTAFMVYLGGISVDRDFSFTEVQTPDGIITPNVLVAKVGAVHAFLPDGIYTPPASYAPYREAISKAKDVDKQEYDEWASELDALIEKSLNDYFPDSSEGEAIQEIVSTFHPEGRYNLLCLIEYAREDDVLDKFLPVLRSALEEEFKYAPPVIARGVGMLPASQRGWAKMEQGLGLHFPRPTQS